MRWLLFVLLGACSFSARSGEQPASDAATGTDGLSNDCTPNETACDGRVRKVCAADGHWDGTLDTVCDFTCSSGACVVASNVPLPDVKMCTSAGPALAPPAGASVTVSTIGGVHIDCLPDCGNSVTRIDATAVFTNVQPNLVWFCLGSIDLPADVKLVAADASAPTSAIALVVDGAVSIAGGIVLDGGSATHDVAGGTGAPGGFAGADLTSSSNSDGQGPCGGHGGDHDGPFIGDHWIGGGGGGGGNGTAGAGGGKGRCVNGDHDGNPGGASDGTCSLATLVPLVGGSGGGAGGDATVNVAQGWAGGGGGGALQISSRVSITISGTLSARGGAGYGETSVDGGGGGGAGGALLLEAPTLTLSGMLLVDGGIGGSAGAGMGGPGASGATPAAVGATFTHNGQGGSGGGGGGGRVRLNGGNAACPAGASPASACTAGPLALQ